MIKLVDSTDITFWYQDKRLETFWISNQRDALASHDCLPESSLDKSRAKRSSLRVGSHWTTAKRPLTLRQTIHR